MLEYLSDEDAEKWLQKFHEHNDAKKKPAVIDNEGIYSYKLILYGENKWF